MQAVIEPVKLSLDVEELEPMTAPGDFWNGFSLGAAIAGGLIAGITFT